MNGREIDWDDAKAHTNVRQHRVSSEEASTVFDDAHAKPEYDEQHSDREIRWLMIGFSSRLRLLTVNFYDPQ